jgi:hypothetical protein
MKIHFFLLKISRKEWLRYYRGTANRVVVTSIYGLKIQISAHHLRVHTTERGIYGFFRLLLDKENKFIRLDKLG